MNDNDIIKVVEHCAGSGKCIDCPAHNYNCTGRLMKCILNLINRLKAENEELQKRIVNWREDMNYNPNKVRAEAINDFAEKVKKKSDYCYLGNIDSLAYRILEKDLNALVKEMTEEAE